MSDGPPEARTTALSPPADAEISSSGPATTVTGQQPPQIPDYDLLRCIGRGSYGEVWLARNVMGTYRAVKVVYRRAFEHERPFEREFEGIQKFEPISRTHDSQVDILHVGRNDAAGYFYYVMELADCAEGEKEKRGKGAEEKSLNEPAPSPLFPSAPLPPFSPASYVPHTLKLDLHRRARLPVDQCVEIGLALTTAVQHLHENGLVHRDIKPSNIIFVGGVPKLADIGLVASMDATMSFVGTSGFLPPEGPGTPQADLFSLGKVLYEMCTGRDRQEFPKLPPELIEVAAGDSPAGQPGDSPGESAVEDLERVDQRRSDPRVKTPPSAAGATTAATTLLELNAVILKACHQNPHQRYQSADEFRSDLALLQRGKSVKARRAVEQRWILAKKLGVAASTVALLIAALPFLKPKTGHRPTPEAARFYELGRWHYGQLTPGGHNKALNYLNQALQNDPQFLQPYAELVALYVWNALGISTEQERLRKTKEIADKLALIAPESAERHLASSWCRFLERDWRGAEEEIARAIKINPNLAIARDVYSFYLTMLGRFEEAHREARRAEELEPSARASAIVAAWPFIGERRYDRAVAQLQRVMELDQNFSYGHFFLGNCYTAQTNYVAAIEEFKKSDLSDVEDPSKIAAFYSALRQAYDTSGEQGYWRNLIELIRSESLPGHHLFDESDLAACYARLGEKQKALDYLEANFEKPGGWHRLKFEPLYDSLHDEQRFKILLRRAGLEK